MNGVSVEDVSPQALSSNGASTKNGTRGVEVDPDSEASTVLSTQVTSAFSDLARVQDELNSRLQEFGEREAEIIALQDALESERDKLEAQTARVERLNRQTKAREDTFNKRENAVERRERAVKSFQTMLVHMAAALEDPTSENLSAALEHATTALGDGHAAAGAAAHATEGVVDDQETQPAVAVGDDEAVDLTDLNTEELHRLKMLQQLGTASVTEIADQIRTEREGASGSRRGRKKKKHGSKVRSWLF